MKKDKKYYFEKAPIYSSILFFAIPTIISQLITLIYNWADTFFVGQLTNELLITAVSVCHPAFMITSVIANLFGIGGASVISRALGVNNEEKVKKMATFSILWATIVGIVYSLFVYIFRAPILRLCGASDATMVFAEEYLFWVVVIGALPSVLSATFGHLVRSIGKTKVASFGIVLGAVTNIILDPILIYIFKMDIVGAAIATTISNVLASIFFILYLTITKKDHPLSFSFANLKIEEPVFKEMFASGISSAILTFMAVLSNVSINKLTSGYDDLATAGVSIAKRIDLFVLSLAQGLSQGILPLVGYNHAAKNFKRRNKIIFTTGLVAIIISIAFVCIALPFSKQLVDIFTNSEETISYGKNFLRILCVTMPITCLIFLLNTVFQATKETKKALTITLLRKGVIDIPLMLLLNSTALGLYGIILSQPLIDILSALIATPLLISFIIKSKKEIQEN